MKRKNTRSNYVSKTERLRKKIARKPFVPRVKSLETKTTTIHNQRLRFDDSSAATVDKMTVINAVPVGGSSQARIGKKISGSGIAIKGYVRASTATLYDKVSLILLWVRSPNQTPLPPITQILTGSTANDHTNLDFVSKFKIMRRWDFNIVGNTTTPSTGLELQHIDEYIKLKENKYETLWSNGDNTGAYTQMDKGGFILFAVGMNAYNVDTTPLFIGSTRYYFNDV